MKFTAQQIIKIKGGVMSGFIRPASHSTCRGCGKGNFERVFDRRLKFNLPVCSHCGGDPTHYRVVYKLPVENGKYKTVSVVKDESSKRFTCPVKAFGYIEVIRNKMKEQKESFNYRAVGSKVDRDSFLLKNFAAEFLIEQERRFKSGELAPSSMADIESLLRLYIVPLFGEMKLSQITYKAIKRTLDKARQHKDKRKLLSDDSKKSIVGVLRVLMKYAAIEERIQGVPEFPKYRNKRKFKQEDLYTPQQVELVIRNVKKREHQIALYIKAFYTRRKSEIIALRWKDIDFKKRTVTFRRHVSAGSGIGKKEMEGLKSSMDKELVYPFFPGLREMLKELGPDLDRDRLIFPGRDGGLMGKDQLRKAWVGSIEDLMQTKRNGKPLLDKYVDLHRGCRNSILTSMINEGHSEDTVLEFYGGDRRTMLKHYVDKRRQNVGKVWGMTLQRD